MEKELFQENIVSWYKKNGRSFFWRKNNLTIWNWIILETLLKRTKAETVQKYGKTILLKYDTPLKICLVDEIVLKNDIRRFGLLNQRYFQLKKISNYIVNDLGKENVTENDILNIKYLGKYILNAVLCFGLKKRYYLLDTNIARVISRYFEVNMPIDLRNKNFNNFVSDLLPKKSWIEYNYGLIDLGSLFCKNKPFCKICPLCVFCKKYLVFL